MEQVHFEIHKGVPVPPRSVGGKQSGASKYPFATMVPGDSIEVPEANKLAVRSALTAYRKKNKDRVFATRVLEGGGVGIWRTA